MIVLHYKEATTQRDNRRTLKTQQNANRKKKKKKKEEKKKTKKEPEKTNSKIREVEGVAYRLPVPQQHLQPRRHGLRELKE